MGKDTLTKYLNSKVPFKGKIFSHVKIDKNLMPLWYNLNIPLVNWVNCKDLL